MLNLDKARQQAADAERTTLSAAIWTALEPDKPIVAMDWPCRLVSHGQRLAQDGWRKGDIEAWVPSVDLMQQIEAPPWPVYRKYIPEGLFTDMRPIPDYTSEAGFWTLLAAMRERGWDYMFTDTAERPGQHCADFGKSETLAGSAYGDTLPLAAARAALNALSGDRE